MQEIQIKGTQEFLGMNIPVIEGGFGDNKKVMLAKTIAEIHGMKLIHINEIINDNINEFETGIDLLDLKVIGSTDNNLEDLGFTKMQVAKSKSIYLLSEQGYFTLVMLMRTPNAKEIRKKLCREYFAMREIINSELLEEEKLQLAIFKAKDTKGAIMASAELDRFRKAEIEKLEVKLEEQEPMIVEYKAFMENDSQYYTWDNVSKVLDIGRNTLLKKLRELEILQDDYYNRNIPYEKHMKYFKVKLKQLNNGTYTPVTLTNAKGISYIRKKLIENNIIRV